MLKLSFSLLDYKMSLALSSICLSLNDLKDISKSVNIPVVVKEVKAENEVKTEKIEKVDEIKEEKKEDRKEDKKASLTAAKVSLLNNTVEEEGLIEEPEKPLTPPLKRAASDGAISFSANKRGKFNSGSPLVRMASTDSTFKGEYDSYTVFDGQSNMTPRNKGPESNRPISSSRDYKGPYNNNGPSGSLPPNIRQPNALGRIHSEPITPKSRNPLSNQSSFTNYPSSVISPAIVHPGDISARSGMLGDRYRDYDRSGPPSSSSSLNPIPMARAYSDSSTPRQKSSTPKPYLSAPLSNVMPLTNLPYNSLDDRYYASVDSYDRRRDYVPPNPAYPERSYSRSPRDDNSHGYPADSWGSGHSTSGWSNAPPPVVSSSFDYYDSYNQYHPNLAPNTYKDRKGQGYPREHDRGGYYPPR